MMRGMLDLIETVRWMFAVRNAEPRLEVLVALC